MDQNPFLAGSPPGPQLSYAMYLTLCCGLLYLDAFVGLTWPVREEVSLFGRDVPALGPRRRDQKQPACTQVLAVARRQTQGGWNP